MIRMAIFYNLCTLKFVLCLKNLNSAHVSDFVLGSCHITMRYVKKWDLRSWDESANYVKTYAVLLLFDMTTQLPGEGERRTDQTSCTNHTRHSEQVIMKGEESVRGLIELWGESESKLKHHRGKMDGLKMKSPYLLEHYEDTEQKEGWQK